MPQTVAIPEPEQAVVAQPAIPAPVVTYTLIGINIAVYAAMGVSGVSWSQPTSLDGIRWGADFGPLTLSSEWWRLLTSTFVHFGLLHILLNMWCLFRLGRSLEYLMGQQAFAATYVASGLAASLVSVWWRPWGVAAGASGAIFGVAGAFACYVFLQRIANVPKVLARSGKSLGAFIFYNLIYGAGSLHVDNSAHIGGLIAGAVLGALVPPAVHRRVATDISLQGVQTAISPPSSVEDTEEEKRRRNRIAWQIALGSAVVLVAAFIFVRNHDIADAKYGEAVKEIRTGHTTEAAATLEEATRINPELSTASMLLGELRLGQGEPQSAVRPLKNEVDSDPTDLQSRQNLALAYVASGNSAGALEQTAQIVSQEREKPYWGTLFIRGVAEGQSGDYTNAEKDLQAVIEENPSLSEAQSDLARFRGLAEKPPEAVLPQLQIPCSKLVDKSDVWPLFP